MEEELESQPNDAFDESQKEKSRKCSAALVSFVCGRTGLLIIVTGYALFGAILFRTIESGHGSESAPGAATLPDQHIQKSRDDCLKELWLITERLNVLYEKNWTRLVTEQLKRFEKAVIESASKEEYSISSPWTFSGALLYTITLLTTVGYGKLSPKTPVGKAATMVYAIIGVPLMLILLSGLGSLLASGARKGYSKLCCNKEASETTTSTKFMPSVEYQRAPSSPSGKHVFRPPNDDSASIQLTCASHSTIQNHVNHKQIHLKTEHQHIIPKKALLATVRASHARGRCIQGQVRQMLTDTHFCPSHGLQPSRGYIGTIPGSGLQDVEEEDENEQHFTHSTPSRTPLIWRESSSKASSPSPPSSMTPAVPLLLVVTFLASYVCLGATLFTFTNGWSFLDAAYFCFIALSTIGIGDNIHIHENSDYNAQLQMLACCLYLIVGLILVAMCFSLVHDEIVARCRQIAANMGLVRH